MDHVFLGDRELAKYPRTPHLQGSRYQAGDKGLPVAYSSLAGRFIVVEEKLDGANGGTRFDAGGQQLLQSRGHYLAADRMGGRERQFNPLKVWAAAHRAALLDALGDRYVMYFEFMHAKHSIWYDALPHLVIEFDLLDLATNAFLDTERRHALLNALPVVSAPVLYAGIAPRRFQDLLAMIGHSVARTAGWRYRFEAEVRRQGLPLDLCWQQTDRSECAEGLYIKAEEDGEVRGRYKLVRSSFVQTILDSDSHHSTRPIIPNGMRADVDLFAPMTDKGWPCANDGRLPMP